jgi:4'-phosphopantetheinyl transferase
VDAPSLGLSGASITMELPGDEIHLHFSYPEDITDPALLQQYQSLLSDDELVQMSRFYFTRHRHQYLITRALVRTSLSTYFSIAPADWVFGKNGYGKPEISLPRSDLPIRFNLSHSEGLVMCGVTRDCDIGVDVEDAERPTRAAFASLSSYFSAGEIRDINALPVELQKSRFFDYWTLKESYIKARGMGLAIPLSKFSFHFDAGTLNGFKTHPDLDDDASAWRFWRFAMRERYRLAVAIKQKSTDHTVNAFQSIPLQTSEPAQLQLLRSAIPPAAV